MTVTNNKEDVQIGVVAEAAMWCELRIALRGKQNQAQLKITPDTGNKSFFHSTGSPLDLLGLDGIHIGHSASTRPVF
jgi:hypothetical protein